MKVAAAVVASLALASCSLGPAPTLTIPLDRKWGGGFSVLVYDSSQLVAAGRQLMFDGSAHFGDSVVAHPERNELDLTWTGGACSHHPTINISGTADALVIELANGRDPGPIPFIRIENCVLVGIFMGVTLTLKAPVEQQAIEYEFSQ